MSDRHRVGVVLRALLALMGVVQLGTAQPQEPTPTSFAKKVTLNIPAQPLAEALRALGEQSGLTIVIESQLGTELAPTLKGSYSVAEALARILPVTLHAKYLDAKTVAVMASPTTSAAAPSLEDNMRGEGKKSSSDGSHVAQVGQGENQDPNSVEKQNQQTPQRKPVQLEEVLVTGTHIREVPLSSPVITLDRTDIERSGYTSVGDLIRSLPENFGGGNNPAAATGSAPGGASNINTGGGSAPNLRGLGPASTLTLINGHRLAQDTSSGAIDISSIPLDAIERVDVVTDGASAIYGSDAVAGVVNFVLKKNFDGAVTSASFGKATDGGGLEKTVSQLLGSTWNTGGVVFDYEHEQQDAVFSDQRDFTSSVDMPYSLLPGTHRNSFFLSANQDLSSGVGVFFDGLYTSRSADFESNLGPGASYAYLGDVRQYVATMGINAMFSEQWKATLFGSISDQHTEENAYTLPTGPNQLLQEREIVQGRTRYVETNLDGPLWSLPAGPVRLAVGAGYRSEQFGDQIPTSQSSISGGSRDVSYEFVELAIPLIGQSNHAGLHRLDLNMSARHEHYSDVGEKSVPKIGLIFVPYAGVSVRASWGRSFRAPSLANLTSSRILYLLPLPDPTVPSGRSIVLAPAGGNPLLRPETAKSWSVGAELNPEWLRAAKMSLTYFSTVYTNRISQIPSIFTALTDPTDMPFVTRDPSPGQQQDVLNLAGGRIINMSGGVYDPSAVAAIVDYRNTNVARQDINGMDAVFAYNWKLAASAIDTFLNGTYLEVRQRLTLLSPQQELAGTVFNPPRFRARGGATWNVGGWSATGLANFLGSAINTYAPDHTRVASWTTIDGQIAYDTGPAGPGRGIRVRLSVQNIFDKDPPTVKFTTFRTGFDYDVLNTSPLGRFVSLQASKTW